MLNTELGWAFGLHLAQATLLFAETAGRERHARQLCVEAQLEGAKRVLALPVVHRPQAVDSQGEGSRLGERV